MSKRCRNFLTPSQLNKAKQAIDVLWNLTAKCDEGRSTRRVTTQVHKVPLIGKGACT